MLILLGTLCGSVCCCIVPELCNQYRAKRHKISVIQWKGDRLPMNTDDIEEWSAEDKEKLKSLYGRGEVDEQVDVDNT